METMVFGKMQMQMKKNIGLAFKVDVYWQQVGTTEIIAICGPLEELRFS